MQRVGTPNARHNLNNEYRKFLENVKPELSEHNEIIQQRSIEEIYNEKLQSGFEEFNNKQKRKDRRLDVKYGVNTYLEYQRELDRRARDSKNNIGQKGKPPIREIVWQIGNPEQGYGSLNQTAESREKIKQMLLDCQKAAEERYPQFAWGDIVFHADESSVDASGRECGSLHLHSSFVPLCYKNKQGPSVQVAMERCLHEMGFETFEDWKHDLDKLMEDVLQKNGLEREFMDNHEKHQSSTEFHRQQKIIRQTKAMELEADKINAMTEQVIERYNSISEQMDAQQARFDQNKQIIENQENDLKHLQNQFNELQEALPPIEQLEIKPKKTLWGNNVKVTSDDYKLLRDFAEQSLAAKKQNELLSGKVDELERENKELDDECNHLWDELQKYKSADNRIEQAEAKQRDEIELNLRLQKEELERKLERLMWILNKAFNFLNSFDNGVKELESWKEYYEKELGKKFLTMNDFIKYWYQDNDQQKDFEK